MQAFWFYVAFILIVLATVLHNPTGGYERDQLRLRRIEVQTPFLSEHMYYWCWYSGDTDRENGLRYLELGKDRLALAASGISPEPIGRRMREEYEKYKQHELGDREKEEEWVRVMERDGWRRGNYTKADLTRPKRWFIDPRGWDSKNHFVISWLPDLSNLLSYFVSIAAILSLTGILGWLAGIRANGNRAHEGIGFNSSAGLSGCPAVGDGISCESLPPQAKRQWWRTFLAVIVCGLLALGYFVGGAVFFGWKNGGGFIPMIIAGTVILTLWGLIRGGTSEDK